MSQDSLTPAAITENLGTTIIGRRVFYYPSLPSTMAAAREQARRGVGDGAVIIAGEQTGGQGRLQRRWLAPPGNIALSVVLYPEVASLPYLMMLASLAVVRAIGEVTGLKADIKWPNDVLVGGKKVAGVLIENELKGCRVRAVIGIGLNVAFRAADYPEVAATATSLNEASGKDVSVVVVARRLLAALDALYLALPDGEPIYRQWRAGLVTLGQRVAVTFTSAGRVLEGVAEDVESNGTLRLRLDDGSASRITAGDVSLRPQ